MLFHGFARHIFHDDIAELVGDDGVVDFDDVRVFQLANQCGFVLEEVGVAFAGVALPEDGRIGEFECDDLVGEGVTGEVDLAGGPGPQFAQQFVLANPLPGLSRAGAGGRGRPLP